MDSSRVTPASHEIDLVTILAVRTMHRLVASTCHPDDYIGLF